MTKTVEYKGYKINLYPKQDIGDIDMFSINGFMGIAPSMFTEYKKGDPIYIGSNIDKFTEKEYDIMISDYKDYKDFLKKTY